MPKLIEVIEFFDESGNSMAYRFPQEGGEAEIKWGAQLTVRESQAAVFFKSGKAYDVFKAGQHTIQTMNIPIVMKAITSIVFGPTSPFRAEVVFCNMKLFRDLKWGTQEPIAFHDAKLEMVRLRAFGMYSCKIKDPVAFVNNIVGTEGLFTVDEISSYLRSIVVARLTDVLGESVTTVFDLPKKYDEIAALATERLKADFEKNGLELVNFFVTNINVPEEIAKMMDEKSGMNAIGDMNKYMQFKAAQAMEAAAKNEGGAAGGAMGVGAGAGMGMGMGMGMAQAFQSMNQASQPAAKEDPATRIKKLKELLDAGAITKEEFDEKKKKLLDEM